MNFKIGIDEAGRGPWAGPVYAGIVVLTTEQEVILKEAGVGDSKKLSQKKRVALCEVILQNSVYAKVKYLSAEEIDRLGVYKATIALMKLLIEDARTHLFIQEGTVFIDGVFPEFSKNSPDQGITYECIIKGDEKEPSISAASILAKVKRDYYMMKLHEKYPHYSFDKHKGYGTKLHSDILKELGPCEEHRKSFKPVKLLLK